MIRREMKRKYYAFYLSKKEEKEIPNQIIKIYIIEILKDMEKNQN